jgi:tRNA-splicing ligase RtcB
MCLSILDTPVSYLDGAKDKYEKALAEIPNSMYEECKTHIENEIFDDETFNLIPF